MDRLIKPRDAAKLLGVCENTLNKWRMRGYGPRYIKYGSSRNSRIVYPEQGLLSFLNDSSRGCEKA